ncbi:MAG: branched-chain amino acid ABC transporter permease [Dehalococcoidia bacterium]
MQHKFMTGIGGRRFFLPAVIGASVLATLPLYARTYHLHILFILFLYIVLALSYRVFFVTGLGSFCHAAFYGLGAYTSGLLAVRLGLPYFACFLAGGILAALVAAGLAFTTKNSKGVYFFISSFAFYIIVYTIWKHWGSLTGGMAGLRGIPGIMGFTGVMPYYYVALVFLALSTFILYRLHSSRFGRQCVAIGEDDQLAESSGIDVVGHRVIAFAIGALFAGFAGSIYAHYVRSVFPASFSLMFNLYILVWVVLGGERRFWGPIVGAAGMTLIAEVLRAAGPVQAILYGVVLVIAILVMPYGASGLIDTLRARWVSGVGHLKRTSGKLP